MGGNLLDRARQAASDTGRTLNYLLDLADVPDGSPLDRRIQAALENLHEVIDEIPRNKEVLASSLLVFPVQGKDMRDWNLSNGKTARELLNYSPNKRLASAAKILPGPEFNKYRVITAKKYLELLDNAVITNNKNESKLSILTFA